MKKRLLYGCFIAVFLLACLLPVVGMGIFGPSAPAANEQLSQAPKLTDENGKLNTDYLSHLTSYVNDRFYLRQELISLNNRLSATLFQTAGGKDVLVGKNGWLYYAPTLDDYTGQSLMTDAQLSAAARNVFLMQQYCLQEGKDFAFVIAPNKNSLYPENMPHFPAADKKNAAKLLMLLKELQVNSVDLFAAFGSQEEALYFAHDSHWNSKGAALGADCIYKALGIQSDYFSKDFSKEVPHTGDLFEMLYPAMTDNETDKTYSGSLDYTVLQGNRPDSLNIKTQGSGEGSLLVYRDSFGNLLYPYLAAGVGDAHFSRSVVYDLTKETDRVVIELVERNLKNLITYAPLMPAIPADCPQIGNLSGNTQWQTVSGKAPENTLGFSGTLPVAADAGAPIYIVCGDTAYEAFYLTENRYCAYIPVDTTATHLVFTAGGVQQTYAYQ